jgi:hypothetical protein
MDPSNDNSMDKIERELDTIVIHDLPVNADEILRQTEEISARARATNAAARILQEQVESQEQTEGIPEDGSVVAV